MADTGTGSHRERLPDAVAAEFEPAPRVGPVEATRRYWWMVVLAIVIIVPAAGLVAAKRPQEYSAEARLVVGHLNLSEPGAIQGYAQAAQDLAGTYPLAIDADGVVAPLARTFHMSEKTVRDDITASEVPSSAIVLVDTTAKSAHLAVSLANAASGALVAYLVAQNRDNTGVDRLYARMSAAQIAYQKALAAVPVLTNKQRPDAAQQKQLAAAATAKTVLNTAVGAYQSSSQAVTVQSLLQPLVSAHDATSNRKTTIEIALAIGLIAALIIGIGAATLRATAVMRRALTLPAWEPDAS